MSDKEVVTVRITCRNNSDTKKFAKSIGGVPSRHNGGKLIIATCPAGRLEEFKEFLNDENAVSSYELPNT